MQIFFKLWKGSLYSIDGLRATWRRELAFRLEVLVALILCPLLFIFHELSVTQQVIMLFTLILPMILELVNSSLESVCNLFTKDHHGEIKFIKDAASAAVFLANIVLVLTWGICLWPLI